MINPSQRPLPDRTQHSQQTDINASGGIRTHNLSRRAAADLRLGPRGRWDRREGDVLGRKTSTVKGEIRITRSARSVPVIVTRIGFCPTTSIFPCQCISTSAPYSFVCHRPCIRQCHKLTASLNKTRRSRHVPVSTLNFQCIRCNYTVNVRIR